MSSLLLLGVVSLCLSGGWVFCGWVKLLLFTGCYSSTSSFSFCVLSIFTYKIYVAAFSIIIIIIIIFFIISIFYIYFTILLWYYYTSI